MKKYLFYILLPLLAASCDDDDKVVMPDAEFTMSADEVSIYETVTYTYTGSPSTQVVIYTGDTGHNFDLKDDGNSGFVVNDGVATYAYKEPGTFDVVVVATNYDKYGGESMMNIARKTITVKDDDNELRTLSLKRDIYNKELPAHIEGNDILLAVPEKVRISNRDIAVSLKAQRLEVATMSANASVLVEDAPFVATSKYNLTVPLKLSVVAASGDKRDYMIHAVTLPSFSAFAVGTAKGTIAFSDYDFDKTTVTVTVPAGTDLTSVTPEFTAAAAKRIRVNGVDQVSGSTAVDFSEPVVYELTNWEDGNEAMACTSYVTVTVNK